MEESSPDIAQKKIRTASHSPDFLSLQSLRLTNHILHNNIKNFSDRITIFQYFPRFICMEMNLYQIFISCCNQAVSLKMLCNVIRNLILIQFSRSKAVYHNDMQTDHLLHQLNLLPLCASCYYLHFAACRIRLVRYL